MGEVMADMVHAHAWALAALHGCVGKCATHAHWPECICGPIMYVPVPFEVQTCPLISKVPSMVGPLSVSTAQPTYLGA